MKQIGRYLLILVAVLALWNTVVIKPLKLFSVFLHELGHAFMAFIFGSGIQAFKVNLNESGYTLAQTKGWFSTFMVANGGYLGGVFFALLILYLKRTSLKKFILGSLAILFLFISIRFSGFSFTLLFSVLFAAFTIVVYMLQNERIEDWVLDIIGIASISYAIYDAFVDIILLQLNISFHLIPGWTKQPVTDAVALARMTHIPALLWGIIWLGIAFLAIYVTLLKAPKASKGRR